MAKHFQDELSELSSYLTVDKVISGERRKFDYRKHPLIHDEALYVTSLANREILYSKYIKNLLGYGQEEFNYDMLYDLIHPDDYPAVRHIVKSTLLFSSIYGLHRDSVLFITYRIRRKDGTYTKVQRTSGVCRLKRNRSLEANYSILQDIAFMNMGDRVKYKWSSPSVDQEAYRKFIQFSPDQFFTHRQLEILELMRSGHTQLEMAEALGVRLSTIQTQRKRMLARVNCSSTEEMIDFFDKNFPIIPEEGPWPQLKKEKNE